MASKRSWFNFAGRRPAKPASSLLPGSPGHQVHEYFQAKARQQGYTLSEGQARVIDTLARRVEPLLQSLEDPTQRPPSLYLYGAVGRGKSWLLDGFFQASPVSQKRRLHFHQFFAQLHDGMFRHRAEADALETTLDELLSDCRLLCFDEFHVHDIGDAMLITRLFKALFARGILLIVTSNYAPEGLLPNPLYHERFLPVIKLIHSDMEVLEVGGAQDYRALPESGTSQRFVEGRYVWPGSEEQRAALQLPPVPAPFPLTVGKRQLQARMSHERSIRFDFDDICEQPTAVIDYLDLCTRFDDWIIDHLPLLGECSIAVQQRFINLIDVLYDQDKTLTLVSEHPLQSALAASAIDLMRSQSRLGQLRVIGPV